jgi:hypothetical protein
LPSPTPIATGDVPEVAGISRSTQERTGVLPKQLQDKLRPCGPAGQLMPPRVVQAPCPRRFRVPSRSAVRSVLAPSPLSADRARQPDDPGRSSDPARAWTASPLHQGNDLLHRLGSPKPGSVTVPGAVAFEREYLTEDRAGQLPQGRGRSPMPHGCHKFHDRTTFSPFVCGPWWGPGKPEP